MATDASANGSFDGYHLAQVNIGTTTLPLQPGPHNDHVLPLDAGGVVNVNEV